MAYIVVLTIIMQIVFAITTSTESVVSRHLIKVALRTFIDSPQRLHVHSSINQHFQSLGAFLDRDAAVQKITELVESNHISTKDMAEIKTVMKNFDIKDDEPW